MAYNEREPVYCDCCGIQVVGYRVDGKIIWWIEQHGKRHFKAIIAPQVLETSSTPLDKLPHRV